MNRNRPRTNLAQVFRMWHLSEMPLLLPAAGFAAGIGVAAWSPGVAVFAIIGVIIVAGMVLRRPRVALTALFGMAGAVWMWLNLPPELDLPARGEFRGEVMEVRERDGDQRLIVRLDNGARVAFTLYGFDYQVISGDSITFEGMLVPPAREVSVPGEDDGRMTALRQRLSARCRVKEGSVRILKEAHEFNLLIFKARQGFKQLIADSGVSQPTEQFLVAVLAGDNHVDQEVRDSFSRAGMSHLLALSGTHIGVIALLIAFLFIPVELVGSRVTRISITLFLLWVYAFLTGMMPSVVRATIMATFVLLARAWNGSSNPMNALCGAALCILLFNPESLFMPGFQLSFMAVVGILMLMPLREAFGLRNRWARMFVAAVWLPVSAVIATAPLTAWHFHQLPTLFLVANLPAAVLLPAILVAGILLIILTAAGVYAGWLVWLADHLCGLTEWIADATGNLPGATVGEIYFPAWLLLPIYGAMFVIWLTFRTEERKYLVNGLMLLIFSGFLFYLTIPDFPEREMLSWRTANSTNILVKSGDKVMIYSDVSPIHYNELREQAHRQLREYLERRHIADSLEIRCLDKMVPRGNSSRSLQLDNVHQKSLIIPRKFRGPILEIAAQNPEKELVLSPAIPPVRRKAFADSLSETGIRFRYKL